MHGSSEPQRPTITTVTIPQKVLTQPSKVPPLDNEVEADDDDRVICRGID